jgi:predicted metal-dependent enzyme (double-stranded beta helix superfamily)
MPSESSTHAARPCADDRYGLQPGTHAAVGAWAAQVDAILDEQAGDDSVPERVATLLTTLLETPDLLPAAQRVPRADWYAKHRLYACPQGRFTLLALVWLPEQATVIHAHTAWGAVGVYEGHPNVACYDCTENADGSHSVTQTMDERFDPGALCSLRPGLGDTHRIYNASGETMITLHCYGTDLVDDPDGININLTLSA